MGKGFKTQAKTFAKLVEGVVCDAVLHHGATCKPQNTEPPITQATVIREQHPWCSDTSYCQRTACLKRGMNPPPDCSPCDPSPWPHRR